MKLLPHEKTSPLSATAVVAVPGRYLRTLTSSDMGGVTDTRRDVIVTVYRGVQNRMVSG